MKRLSEEATIHQEVEYKDCRFGRYTEIGPFSYLDNTVLEDYSYSGQFCFFQNARIGKFSNIAAQVRIGPTNHPMDRPTLHHFTYRRKMYGLDERDDEAFFQWRKEQVAYVGHDTWLGHGSILMSGIRVGTGAVIGAGAVVTGDIPDYAVAVGVPARVIRYRFEEEQQQALKEIAWWDWSHEALGKAMEDFTGPIESFIEKYGSKR